MQMGTGLTLWAGYLSALAGIGIVLTNGIRLARFWGTGAEVRHASMIIIGFYPLGVGCKMAIMGPEFMRFYLSDIGFPVFLGYVLFEFFTRNRKVPGRQDAVVFLEDFLDVLQLRRVWLVAAVCLSLLFELLMGLFFHLQPDLKDLRAVGDFDWWDVAAYFAGGGIGYAILVLWSKWVHEALGHQRSIQKPAQPSRKRKQPKKGRRKNR